MRSVCRPLAAKLEQPGNFTEAGRAVLPCGAAVQSIWPCSQKKLAPRERDASLSHRRTPRFEYSRYWHFGGPPAVASCVNAVASTTCSDNGMLAMLAGRLSGAPLPTTPDSAAFLNIVNLLLTPEAGGNAADAATDSTGTPETSPALPLPAIASPVQLADALIRSMLCGGETNSAPHDELTAAYNNAVSGGAGGPDTDAVVATGLTAQAALTLTGALAEVTPGTADESGPLNGASAKKKKSSQDTPDETGTLADPNQLRLAPLSLEQSSPDPSALGQTASAQIASSQSAVLGAAQSAGVPSAVDAAGGTQSDARGASPQGGTPAAALARTSAAANVAFRAHLTGKDPGAQSGTAANPSTEAVDPERAQGATREPASFSGGASANGNADAQDGNSGNSQTWERLRQDSSVDAMAAGASAHAAFSDTVPGPVASHAAAAPAGESGRAAVPTLPSSTRLAEAAGTPSASSAAQTGPREIVVRVGRPDAQPVDVQIRQRAGEIQVAVRTPDASMRNSLRAELPDLVGSLDRAGYRAEVFAGGSGEAIGFPGRPEFMDARGDSSSQHGSQPDASQGREAGRDAGRNGGGDTNQQGSGHENARGSARERLAQTWQDRMEE